MSDSPMKMEKLRDKHRAKAKKGGLLAGLHEVLAEGAEMRRLEALASRVRGDTPPWWESPTPVREVDR